MVAKHARRREIAAGVRERLRMDPEIAIVVFVAGIARIPALPLPNRGRCVTLRSAMTLDPALEAQVRSLVDEYRERCLWFVRSDYYPSTPEEILRVLRWIRGGDKEAFQRAGKIEEWLSRTSSEKSVAS
jgi:hypothetical protein